MTNSELSFSQDGLLNRIFYYAEKNDINFFVEDSGKEYEYETLFKRMFQDKISISSIFPTGGKEALIEAYKIFGASYVCNNIYLADGDFDRIIGRDLVNDNNFIYLEAYNIENYYIDFDATLLFLKGKLKKTNDKIISELNFENWYLNTTEQLFELFTLYCVVKKYKSHIPNVAIGPFICLDPSTGFVKECVIDDYLASIKLEIDQIEQKMIDIKDRHFQINGEDKSKMICGKYLFESLVFYLRSTFGISFKKDDFKWFLICNFSLSNLNYVRDKIIDSLDN